MERDPSQKPKYWGMEKGVKWLANTPAVVQVAAEVTGTPVPPSAAGVATAEPGAAGDDDEEQLDESGGKGLRWSRGKAARMIMAIASDELLCDFVDRDRKLNRQEMDSRGKDNFWEKLALVYNSDQTFILPVSKFGPHKYKGMTVSPTSYVADATKLKKEFADIRASLTKAVANWRKSGNGRDADPELGGEEASEGREIFSDDFQDFTHGDEILDLTYEVFTAKDILNAACCDMPEDSKASSQSKRLVAELKQPKPTSETRKKHKGIALADLKSVMHSMPPLKMHKSRVQKAPSRLSASGSCSKRRWGSTRPRRSIPRSSRTPSMTSGLLKTQERTMGLLMNSRSRL